MKSQLVVSDSALISSVKLPPNKVNIALVKHALGDEEQLLAEQFPVPVKDDDGSVNVSSFLVTLIRVHIFGQLSPGEGVIICGCGDNSRLWVIVE